MFTCCILRCVYICVKNLSNFCRIKKRYQRICISRSIQISRKNGTLHWVGLGGEGGPRRGADSVEGVTGEAGRGRGDGTRGPCLPEGVNLQAQG